MIFVKTEINEKIKILKKKQMRNSKILLFFFGSLSPTLAESVFCLSEEGVLLEFFLADCRN